MNDVRVIEKRIVAQVVNHQIRATISVGEVKVAKIAEQGLPGVDGDGESLFELDVNGDLMPL